MTENNQDYKVPSDLSPDEFYKLTKPEKNKNHVILDVRTPCEYREGHIAGAININFYHRDFSSLLSMLDKGDTYFIYCRRGNRSKKTLEIMHAMGYPHLFHMREGIEGWARCSLPLVKE